VNGKVWFITGAGRGLGADIARTVLAAGHALVATGRDTDRIAAADAMATAEQKIAGLQVQLEAYRELSTSLEFDE
jgi:NAD(P)-dependent dehydrogenase (short-subunit alcohol dehydrogenase family)